MFRQLLATAVLRIPGLVARLVKDKRTLAQPDVEDSRPAREVDYWRLLAEDYQTYDRDLFEPGFWAIRVHRFGMRVDSLPWQPLRNIGDGAHRVMSTGVDWLWGIHLPRTVVLGRRVRLWHHGTMLLAARSIGNDVHIRQITTFGSASGSTGPTTELPVIADGADIGSGCCVFGSIVIGRNALVGANSVVVDDVPANANVLGVPARTLPPWSLGPRANAVGGLPKDVGQPLPLGDSNENPKGIAMTALLSEDFTTNGGTFWAPGFWAVAVHRVGNWRMGIRSKLLRAPVGVFYRGAYQAVIAVWGIDLPYNAKLGRRLRIQKQGTVLMGVRQVGDDVKVRGPVTVGLRRREDPSAPTIGNRVTIENNACIIGNIHIGDDTHVGANTVLAKDIPAGSFVLGIPGRRVSPAVYFGGSSKATDVD